MSGKYAALTSTPDRSQALSGITLSRPQPPTTAAPARSDGTETIVDHASTTSDPPSQPAVTEGSKPKARRGRSRKTSAEPETGSAPVPLQQTEQKGADSPVVQTTVYLGTDLLQWIHARSAADHRPQTQVVLTAVEMAYEALSKRAPEPAPAPRTRLFSSSTSRQAARRRDGRDRKSLFLRVTQTDLKVLDRLVDELGMASRSALIEEAVREVISKEEDNPDAPLARS